MRSAQPEPRPLIGAHVSTAGGLLNAISNATRISAEVIQVFPTNPRRWRPYPYTGQELQEFAQALLDHRLSLYVHTTYLLNLASPDEALRATSAKSLAEAYRFAAHCGAAALVTHIGSHHGEGTVAVAARIIATCMAARSHARHLLEQDTADDHPGGAASLRRFETMPLLMETSAGSGHIIGTLDDLDLLLGMLAECDGVPAGICLDTAHVFAAGTPLHTPEDAQALVALLQSKRLLERLGAVHFNDCETALGSKHDRHANLWEGQIGRAGLQAVMGAPQLARVPFILEVPGFEGHGPDRRNVLRARRMRRAALTEADACPQAQP